MWLPRFLASPWAGAMTTLISVLIGGVSWAGLARPQTDADKVTWLGICLIASLAGTFWSFWALHHENTTLKERFKAKATVTFDSTDATVHVQPGDVFEPQPLISDERVSCKEYKYYVGIVNRSNQELQRMRLVLEESSPHLENIVYRGKPMEVRGEEGPTGYFDVPPRDGVKPSRYVCFFRELVPKDGGPAFMSLPYSSDESGRRKLYRDRISPRRFVYSLEGGGQTESLTIRVEVRFNENANRYVVAII